MVLYFDVPCAGFQGSDFNFSIVLLFNYSIVQLDQLFVNSDLRDASIASLRRKNETNYSFAISFNVSPVTL